MDSNDYQEEENINEEQDENTKNHPVKYNNPTRDKILPTANNYMNTPIFSWKTEEVVGFINDLGLNGLAEDFQNQEFDGPDLILLIENISEENLSKINFHQRNLLIKTLKSYLLKELKLNIFYKDKKFNYQIDYNTDLTVNQITGKFSKFFGHKEDVCMMQTMRDDELLDGNLRIIDLIMIDNNKYKNLKLLTNTNDYTTSNNTNVDVKINRTKIEPEKIEPQFNFNKLNLTPNVKDSKPSTYNKYDFKVPEKNETTKFRYNINDQTFDEIKKKYKAYSNSTLNKDTVKDDQKINDDYPKLDDNIQNNLDNSKFKKDKYNEKVSEEQIPKIPHDTNNTDSKAKYSFSTNELLQYDNNSTSNINKYEKNYLDSTKFTDKYENKYFDNKFTDNQNKQMAPSIDTLVKETPISKKKLGDTENDEFMNELKLLRKKNLEFINNVNSNYPEPKMDNQLFSKKNDFETSPEAGNETISYFKRNKSDMRLFSRNNNENKGEDFRPKDYKKRENVSDNNINPDYSEDTNNYMDKKYIKYNSGTNFRNYPSSSNNTARMNEKSYDDMQYNQNDMKLGLQNKLNRIRDQFTFENNPNKDKTFEYKINRKMNLNEK